MKARVKETGEIIEVNCLYPVTYSRLDCNGKTVEEYDEEELELLIKPSNKRVRQEQLLVKLIETIGDATNGMTDDEYDYGHGWIPELRYCPDFEFDSEDIQTIRELAEEYPECSTFLEWIEG